MVWSPQVRRIRPGGGGAETFVVGHPLVDDFLAFAAGRARPNTVAAYAYDLKVFFTVVAKEPTEVRARDVFDFVAAQHQPRPGADNVVRIADGASGMAVATVRRRLAALSSFYSYAITRGDTGIETNPVPRGLPVRRSRRGGRGQPLVRAVRRLPRILEPEEVAALMSSLRRERDRAMVQAMVLGGLRRAEVVGLRLEDLRLGEWRVHVVEGKGGHERIVPVSSSFFATVASYINNERPPDAATDRLFVVKGPEPRSAAVAGGDRRDHGRGPGPRRARPWHLPRVAPHLSHPLARSRHDDRGPPGPGRPSLHRLDPGLSPPRRRLVGR